MPLLHCVLLVAPCLADDKPKPPTQAEIREAKVYEAIAEMVVRRDDLLQKFAVVMHGEGASLGMDAGPIVRPAVNVRLVDRSKKFDMRSESMAKSSRTLTNCRRTCMRMKRIGIVNSASALRQK